MKPALSPTTTGALPSRSHSALASENTSSDVITVRTISTKSRIGAGLKKCMPTTRDGDLAETAISVTDKEEVLVARIASAATIWSSWAKTDFFSSRLSGMDSTTSWQSLTRGQVQGVGDPIQGGGALLLGELAALDGPGGGGGERRLAALEGRLDDVDGHDVNPFAGDHLGDPDTHRPEPDNAHFGELTTHMASLAEPPTER